MKDTRVITEDDVARATKLLEKYKSAKSAYERRVIADEEWWKMRAEPGREATGWLFNAIANKHADAMDNLPSPVVLPREETDTASATALSEIIPVILDAASFDRVYSEVWYDKLKHGTGCYGVFWDPERSHGKGDIAIEKIDILNLFWQGGVSDIQKSENLFYTSLWDNEKIKEKYPHVGELCGTPTFETSKYLSDETEEKEGKSVVVDWYYKRRVGGRDILHLCKFCSGQLLYATENDERFKDGLYAHGKYPFFIDKLYTMQGTPCGFGLVDAMKNTQSQIDRLSTALVKNAELSSAVRYFIRTDGSINEEEFADFTKPFVHVQGSRLGEDSIRQINAPRLDALAVSVMADKITELKETAGSRDFTQGGTMGGITAASAIIALQEAGNKLARDMIAQSNAVFKSIVEMIIELIRQFYSLPRMFRVIGDDGKLSFVEFSALPMRSGENVVFGYGFKSFDPEYDVAISSEKKSPFARATQNELAKEFFNMGLFNPDRREEAVMCVSMMDFEGKERVLKRLTESASAF